MKKAYINLAITTLVVASMTAAIFYLMQNSLFTVSFLGTNYLNKTFVYQATTLALSLVVVLITALLTKFKSIKLLSIKNIDGEVFRNPGSNNKNNKDLEKGGLNFTIIISIVTAAIYFKYTGTE